MEEKDIYVLKGWRDMMILLGNNETAQALEDRIWNIVKTTEIVPLKPVDSKTLAQEENQDETSHFSFLGENYK